jgi:hypothetical protein
MASTDEVVKELYAKVNGCLAVAVVDLHSGMLLGIYHTVPHFTQAYLDVVAAAAVDMFRGTTVRRMEELLSAACGREIKDSFEEIFISTSHVYHFMVIIKEKAAAVIMVTRKATNQGLGWAILRTNLTVIAASLS